MRAIEHIVIHCSATAEGKEITAADVDKWHKAKGWEGIGYHFFIKLDGTIELGRRIKQIGSHVAGHNKNSIGICYAGGVETDNKTPKDTRTKAQMESMKKLVQDLLVRFPSAKVVGHRDFAGVNKACPSFEVSEWLKTSKIQ
jgi:N-acetylmuramoyl-L-alanine amidase